MHAKSIITSVSAATLMAAFGIANAAPQRSPQSKPRTQRNSGHQQIGMQSQLQQVASQAAMVLRKNANNSAQRSQNSTASQQIPQQVIAAARCVAVFPSSTTPMTAGANTSSSSLVNTHLTSISERIGVANCRDDSGQWTSSPVFARIYKSHLTNDAMGTGMDTGATTGGSTGSAIVLVFANYEAAKTLRSGEFTLGDDVDVIAGPTNLQNGGTVSAPVLAYVSTSKGGFTGANVDRATVQFDKQANQQIYGHGADPKDLLQGKGNNSQPNSRLTAFNQALSQFAPPSKYNSNASIVK